MHCVETVMKQVIKSSQIARSFGERLRPGQGFTLVEVLIVLLVLAILMAVALPAYLSAVSDSQTKDCRANMQTIGNIEREYKIKGTADANGNVTHSYTTSLSNLASINPTVPKYCPTTGQ